MRRRRYLLHASLSMLLLAGTATAAHKEVAVPEAATTDTTAEAGEAEPVAGGDPDSEAVREHWTTVALIPWGDGPGELSQAIDSGDPNQVYRGPTALAAFESDGFAVLDTLDSAVEEFDSGGKHSRRIPFPAHDPHDAEILAVDMAAFAPGDYYLLTLGHRSVLHVTDGREPEELPIPGLRDDAILMGLTRSGPEELYVLDGMDNQVHRLDTSGREATAFRTDVAAALAADSDGRLHNLRPASPDHLNALELIRITPGDELREEVLGKIESDLEMNQFDVFGVDRSGNVYAKIGAGAIEMPLRVEVLRFSPAGEITGRVPSPDDPTALSFRHAKAVAPDGTVYAMVVRQTGLEVMRLERW